MARRRNISVEIVNRSRAAPSLTFDREFPVLSSRHSGWDPAVSPGSTRGEIHMKQLSGLIPARTTRRFRLGAAVALAALATAGAGTLSASAASGAVGAVSPKVAGCAGSQLTVWLGIPGEHVPGSTYYEMQISNIGTSTCSLY